MLKVIGKTNCIQCKMTRKLLDQAKVDYQYINLAEHPSLIEKIKATGVSQVPIILRDDRLLFTGFRPDKLKALN